MTAGTVALPSMATVSTTAVTRRGCGSVAAIHASVVGKTGPANTPSRKNPTGAPTATVRSVSAAPNASNVVTRMRTGAQPFVITGTTRRPVASPSQNSDVSADAVSGA